MCEVPRSPSGPVRPRGGKTQPRPRGVHGDVDGSSADVWVRKDTRVPDLVRPTGGRSRVDVGGFGVDVWAGR